MHLRKKKSLSIGVICQQWINSPEAASNPMNLLTLILQGFWQGSLRNIFPSSDEDAFTRRQGLNVFSDLGSGDEHPEIVVCRDQKQLGAEQKLLPNGDIVVDLRTFIYLPEKEDEWTEEICNQAYEKLSECEATAFAPHFLTGFKTMRVGKKDFLFFLRCYELQPPWFWYDQKDPSAGLIKPKEPTAAPIKSSRRGRPQKYDYDSINKFLEKLALKHGIEALKNNFQFIKTSLINNHDKDQVPSDSQLRRHINGWLQKQDIGN